MKNFFVEVYVFIVGKCRRHVKVPAFSKWETLNNWNMYKFSSASDQKSLIFRNYMNGTAKIKHDKLCNTSCTVCYHVTLQKFLLYSWMIDSVHVNSNFKS